MSARARLTVCGICGLTFDASDRAQREAHRRLHPRPIYRPRDLANLRPLRTPNVRVIADRGLFDYVAVVTPRSWVWLRHHAALVALRAKRDCGWMWPAFRATELPDARRVHVLLRVIGDQYVAFAVVQKVRRDAQVMWTCITTGQPGSLYEPPTDVRTRAASGHTWGVQTIWTAPEWRGRGIALELVDAVSDATGARHTVFIPPLTPLGLALARAIMPDALRIGWSV